MIELFLKAIDRVIDLLRIREKRAVNRYEEIYKPSFAELQSVHSDYVAMLTEFAIRVKKIPDGATEADETAKDAMEFLRQRRTALSAVREKLWAFKSLLEDDDQAKDLPELEREFLWSLVSYFEATEIIQDTKNTTYATDLLDKLEIALKPVEVRDANAERDEDIERSPSFTLNYVKQECNGVIRWLGVAWSKTVVIFNKLRMERTQHGS
jgi:hypothetical protein